MQLLLGLNMWIDIFLKETCLFIICMYAYIIYGFLVSLYVCMSVYHMHSLHPQRLEKGVGFPGIEITVSSEQLCGCWELNLLDE